jgi:hypothetical protein
VKRVKRNLKGEEIKRATIEFRASVHDKLEFMRPPGCSKSAAIETMIETCYKLQKKLHTESKDSTC